MKKKTLRLERMDDVKKRGEREKWERCARNIEGFLSCDDGNGEGAFHQ